MALICITQWISKQRNQGASLSPARSKCEFQKSQCAADRSIRRIGVQSDVPVLWLCTEKNAPNGSPSGALMDLPVGSLKSHSVEGKHFEQVVFAVLLGEEKPGPLCLEGLRSN